MFFPIENINDAAAFALPSISSIAPEKSRDDPGERELRGPFFKMMRSKGSGERYSFLRKVPLLPPLFLTSRISSIDISRSTALHMS